MKFAYRGDEVATFAEHLKEPITIDLAPADSELDLVMPQ